MIPAYGAQVDMSGDIMYDKHSSRLHVNVLALLCGLIASVSECTNICDIDDNFTIPVVSGVLLYGLIWSTK
jgi:diacylglycerol kinase (CTP)